MKPEEEPEDLEAQEKSDLTICDRCFASVMSGAEFCPECGAPVGSAPAEGSDAAIYPDLARVNLFRMRGDYKAAIDHCRSILRKFPNNVTANQLLGDLSLESGDLQQAKEWYELALDIAPKNAQIKQKLNDTSTRLEQAETAGLVEKLGLPAERSKSGWIAGGSALVVIVVGAIAYIVGTNQPKPVAPRPQFSTISAPAPTTSGASANNPESLSAAPTTATAPILGSDEENALTQQLLTKGDNGNRIAGVSIDPRSLQLTVTYRVEAKDDARAIAVDLGGIALENHATSQLVTLRAIEDGKLKYVADVRRASYEETKTDAWMQANPDPGAVAKHVLSNEWPAAAPVEGDASQPESTGGPPPSTTSGP